VLEAAYPSSPRRRRAELGLFNGEGTGMGSVAARGTLWGLFNAVAELENYRDDDTRDTAAYSVLFGARGAAIAHTYSAALARCRRSTFAAEAPSSLQTASR
jgi:hypothetical protein